MSRLIFSKISTISSPKEVFFSQNKCKYGIIYSQIQCVCETKFTYLLKYKWYIISKR